MTLNVERLYDSFVILNVRMFKIGKNCVALRERKMSAWNIMVNNTHNMCFGKIYNILN